MTVTLPAVPTGAAVVALAFGRPVKPPSIWTWTVLPAWTSAAVASVWVWYVVDAPVVTLIVSPFAVLMVRVSPSTDSTVPWTVSPPPNPPPRPKRGAPLAPGTKLPPGKAPPKTRPLPLVPFVPDAAAVPRPIANATPPMATAAAMTSTRFSKRPLDDDLRTGPGTEATVTGAGATGAVGTAVGSGSTGTNGSVERDGGVCSKLMDISLSFVAQGGDGIESSGLARRPDAEDDADREAEQHSGDDGGRVELEAPTGELADPRRDDETDDDADEAADEREGQRLDEELGEDVAATRADRLADADLAGPFADRDQHDVHDPDAADDQRDRGDPAEQQRQRRADRVGGLKQLRLVEDGEVGVVGR